jgi:hypothetical protein
MSAIPNTGIVYDIRANLGKLRADLAAQERMVADSAQRSQAATERIANQPSNWSATRRIVAQATAQQGRAFTGDDAAVEARQRFRATADGAAEEVEGGGVSGTGLLRTVLRAGIALQATKATIDLIRGAVEGWRAVQADIAGDSEKAAKGYLALSDAIEKIPGVGKPAADLADLISGGAATAARKAIADAEKNDARTKQMATEGAERIEAGRHAVATANAENLRGTQRELALEQERHRVALDSITTAEHEHKITADAAKQLRDAEVFRNREKVYGLQIAESEHKWAQGIAVLAAQARAEGDERRAKDIEFEEEARKAQVEAAKKGADEVARVRDDYAAKRKLREIQDAQEVENERLRIVREHERQREAQQESIDEVINRQQKEAEQNRATAADYRFEADQTRLRATGQNQVAEVKRIEKELADVVGAKGYSIFGKPNQDADVIAAAQERADAEIRALHSGQQVRPEVVSGAAFQLVGLNSNTNSPMTKLTDIQEKALAELRKISRGQYAIAG